jgi:hypothetical protein
MPGQPTVLVTEIVKLAGVAVAVLVGVWASVTTGGEHR